MLHRCALALCLIFLSAGRAAADEACILDLQELTPLFTSGTSVLDERGRQLVERVSLEDGTLVTFSQGGCVHYGYTLRFENVPSAVTSMTMDEKLRLLRSLIARLEGDRFSGHLDLMEKAITKKQAFSDDIAPCGDGTCSLTVPENGQLELGYDFPL